MAKNFIKKTARKLYDAYMPFILRSGYKKLVPAVDALSKKDNKIHNNLPF